MFSVAPPAFWNPLVEADLPSPLGVKQKNLQWELHSPKLLSLLLAIKNNSRWKPALRKASDIASDIDIGAFLSMG